MDSMLLAQESALQGKEGEVIHPQEAALEFHVCPLEVYLFLDFFGENIYLWIQRASVLSDCVL